MKGALLTLLGFKSDFKRIPEFFELSGVMLGKHESVCVTKLSLHVDDEGVPFQMLPSFSDLPLLKRLCPLDSVVWSSLAIVRLADASGQCHALFCSCFHPAFIEFRRWVLWLKETDVDQFSETWS